MQNFSDKRLCELLNRREALKLIKSFTEYNSINNFSSHKSELSDNILNFYPALDLG